MHQRAVRNLAKLETTQARMTRLFDAAAGGKNNFQADKDMVRHFEQAAPVVTTAARAVLQFLSRVIRHLAAHEGVDQFMIIGSGVPSGLPPGRRLHDLARQASPSPAVRTVYVENNPMVVTMAQATIEPFSDLVRVVDGDVHEIDEMLGDRVVQTFLDWDRPIAVLLLSAQSLDDEEYAHYVIKRLRHTAPAGSFLALAHTTFDAVPQELLPAVRDMLAMTLPRLAIRTKEEVEALLDGLDLVDPGLVWVPEWHAGAPGDAAPEDDDAACADQPAASGNYGAVAHIP
ncbi:SAM-dependent methyltransferase [Nonomuraea sp. LP-02]|uniref:SAM-dependent methyltransferase n=1 Tax=Nonomuraea sp. LP-02 TaxID=3097960 RepID=UPI002E33554D|nr:SAM-dependent methyltransferase [Nonomuraea sp. LP-02]MED7930775.1 SAM-dependent methyltransferase [Nonomuraea sp. LP-02]